MVMMVCLMLESAYTGCRFLPMQVITWISHELEYSHYERLHKVLRLKLEPSIGLDLCCVGC